MNNHYTTGASVYVPPDVHDDRDRSVSGDGGLHRAGRHESARQSSLLHPQARGGRELLYTAPAYRRSCVPRVGMGCLQVCFRQPSVVCMANGQRSTQKYMRKWLFTRGSRRAFSPSLPPSPACFQSRSGRSSGIVEQASPMGPTRT